MAVLALFVAVNADGQTTAKPSKPPKDFRLIFGYGGRTQEIFRIDPDGTVYVTAYYGLPAVYQGLDLTTILRCDNCESFPSADTNKSSKVSKKKAAEVSKERRLKKRLSTSQINTIIAELNRAEFLKAENQWIDGCTQTQTISEGTTYTISLRVGGKELHGSTFKGCDPAPGSKAARFFQVYEMLRGLVGKVQAVRVNSLDELYR